jgi:hypothetical protein
MYFEEWKYGISLDSNDVYFSKSLVLKFLKDGLRNNSKI